MFLYAQHTHTHLLTPPPQTRDHINNEVLKGFPIGKLDQSSGLCRPVSYETAHQWMITCGCKYKPFRKTYYNDTHERHDNQLDRVNKSVRHGFVALREEKWFCVSSEQKRRFERKYSDWPSDEMSTRVPKLNVGMFPPDGGSPDYLAERDQNDSIEDWYEYHSDFLPEELTMTLNDGSGGYVSQRRFALLPCAAPRSNEDCISRLCDLLTTSCPQTQILLQNNIDRVVVDSRIRSV